MIFLLLLVLSSVARAQAPAFSGYLAELPAVERMSAAANDDGPRSVLMSLTRLRLRAESAPWEGGRISLEYDAALLAASIAMPLQSAGATNRQCADLTWMPVARDHVQMRHTIDRLSVQHDAGNLRIIAGRQRIAWGTGRVWNPTDLFSPINPTAWDKIEKDGADALLARWTAGDFTDLTMVVNPAGTRGTNGAMRFRTNFDPYDVSVMGGMFDRRIVAGGDMAGSVAGAGVRAEGIVVMRRERPASNYVRWVAGADFQFTPDLYALAEFQFNGEGAADPSHYDIARLSRGEILNVGRRYLIVSTMLRLHPLVTGTLAWSGSLTDRSGYAAATVSWSATDAATVMLGGLIPYSRIAGEFGYYPKAVYARGEWSF